MNQDAKDILKHYLTFSGEKIHFIKRTSILTLIPLFVLVIFLSTFIAFGFYILAYYGLLSFHIAAIGIVLMIDIAILLCLKVVIEWYFHIYIVTNKKILEIVYIPLSSYTVNDVFLEQVKCTEIDIRMSGFLREMLGIGDIAMTFDRPTHHEEFILSNMTHARQIGSLLTQLLMNSSSALADSSSWYKDNKDHKFYMIDTIIPKQAL
jgi:hypothetical protein